MNESGIQSWVINLENRNNMPHDGAKSISRKRGRGDLTSTDCFNGEKDFFNLQRRKNNFRMREEGLREIDQSENTPTLTTHTPKTQIFIFIQTQTKKTSNFFSQTKNWSFESAACYFYGIAWWLIMMTHNGWVITFEIKFSIAVFAWSISLWPWTVFWFIEAEVSKTKHKSGIVWRVYFQQKKSNKFFQMGRAIKNWKEIEKKNWTRHQRYPKSNCVMRGLRACLYTPREHHVIQ